MAVIKADQTLDCFKHQRRNQNNSIPALRNSFWKIIELTQGKITNPNKRRIPNFLEFGKNVAAATNP